MSRREEVMVAFEQQKEYMDRRVEQGIEQYRKGDLKLRFADSDNQPVTDVQVELEQIDHDFNFGANLFMLEEFEREEDNAAYREMYAKLFNAATLPFYWADLEPERGQLRFSKDSPKRYRRPAPDLCLEYCEANGIRPKAHCLNYDQWTPTWVPREVNEVKRLLEKRMTELAERYKDRIYGWEVTNELLLKPGYRPQDNRASTPLFWEPDVLEWSFETARRHFPLNELIINEAGSGIWNDFRQNRSAYYMQIERALRNGAPIDTIGFQCHMFIPREQEKDMVQTRYNPEYVYAMLNRYGDFNRPMQITEVTVPAYSTDPEDEALQAEIAKNLYSMWFSCEHMESIIYWNTIDGYAWHSKANPSWNENYYFGGLVRKDFTPKPIYHTLYELIHKTWHTSTSAHADAQGIAQARAFYGTYRMKVTANGKTTEQTVHFGKGTESPIQITL